MESKPPKQEEEKQEPKEEDKGPTVFRRYQAKSGHNEKGERIMNEYVFKQKLGQGGFAEVHAVDRTINVNGTISTATYAMKCMNKKVLKSGANMISEYDKEGNLITMKLWDKVKVEMDIWSKLFNDNIIRLYEITDDFDDDEIYLTTEFAKYGTIAD